MDTTKNTWFRLDLYRPGKKGIKSQSWYPSSQSAQRAKNAINTFPYAWRVITFEAGDKLITKSKKCGGLVAQGPYQDENVNF